MGLGSSGDGIVNPVKAVSHKEFGKGFTHMQVEKKVRGFGKVWLSCHSLYICLQPTVSLVDMSDSEEEEEVEEQQWKKRKVSTS